MANNLHISYDLMNPGQNYQKAINAVQALGSWAKIHQSFWYVNSTYSARQACDAIAAVLDTNDKVYVVDATNKEAAWNKLPDDVSKHIINYWHK